MTGCYRLCPCGTTCTFWGRIYLCHPGLRWELNWKRSELSQWRLPKTSKQLCLQITQRESKLPQLYRLQEDDISEAAVSPRWDFYESAPQQARGGWGVGQAPHATYVPVPISARSNISAAPTAAAGGAGGLGGKRVSGTG